MEQKEQPASETSESFKEVVPTDLSRACPHFVAGNDYVSHSINQNCQLFKQIHYDQRVRVMSRV